MRVLGVFAGFHFWYGLDGWWVGYHVGNGAYHQDGKDSVSYFTGSFEVDMAFGV